MIFRGKNFLFYKLFDVIMICFKKVFCYSKKSKKKSKKRRRIDLYVVFRKVILNLIFILGIFNVKRGRKVEVVFVLLKFRKRIVLINKWLIFN